MQSRNTTPVGFEPTRGDPIGLAGRRLNRSAKVSTSAHAKTSTDMRMFGALTRGVCQVVRAHRGFFGMRQSGPAGPLP